jgi:hypothetical protein
MKTTVGSALIGVMLLGGSVAKAAQFVVDELKLANGLEAVLVRPGNAPQAYPLAVINHGSPREPDDRRKMSPFSTLPQAIEFARRGWASAIVMRRGYGKSSGKWEEATDLAVTRTT